MNPLPAGAALLAALLSSSRPAVLQEPAHGQAQAAASGAYICPPCGAECHFKESAKPGKCGVCGMTLVPLADVPQVGVLLYPNVGLIASTLTLGIFAGSDTARAFTVADSSEPLRAGDALEMRPQFAFADAPALDVLVIPDGYGAEQDTLIVEYVKNAATHARCVLAVGTGSLVLARAGFLAGEHVPAPRFLVERGAKIAPELVFDGALAWRRTGKFFLARDGAGAIEAALAVVQELGGEQKARQTAERLGHTWSPATTSASAPQAKSDGK